MSEQNWTQEPWEAMGVRQSQGYEVWAGALFVCVVRNAEDAARIVADHNALRGIPSEELGDLWEAVEHSAQIAFRMTGSIKAQRVLRLCELHKKGSVQ